MSYKLKHIAIQDFVGIPMGSIDFQRPVSLFVGLNNQGKTSIRNAISFAFTGKARGIEKFKDVSQLAYEGEPKEMLIHLDYLVDDEPAALERKVNNASKGVENHNPLIPYCLDPLSFIYLPARSRGAILSKVLGGGLKELVEEAIAEHIGNINEAILAEIRSSGIDKHDVNALRDTVISIRRNFKRRREECERLAKPKIIDFGLPENFSIESVEAKIKTLDKRIDDGQQYIMAASEATMRKAAIIDLKKDIKNLEAQIKPLPAKPEGISDELIDVATKARDILNYAMTVPEIACPVCTDVHNKVHYKHCLAKLDDWGQKEIAQYQKRKQVEQENDRLQSHIDDRQKQLKALEAKSAEDTQYKKGSEDLLKQLTKDRDDLKEQIYNYRHYKEAEATFNQGKQDWEKFSALINECDRIDDALKDGGPVKAMIAAGGKTLPLNETLLDVWGMRALAWKDNGEITLYGRPLEQASHSEIYRAAAVMGLALAEVGDVGFCALDEYEVLVGDKANRFFDVVTESKINNVLVFASSDQDYRKSKGPDWLEMFEVTGGKIERIL